MAGLGQYTKLQGVWVLWSGLRGGLWGGGSGPWGGGCWGSKQKPLGRTRAEDKTRKSGDLKGEEEGKLGGEAGVNRPNREGEEARKGKGLNKLNPKQKGEKNKLSACARRSLKALRGGKKIRSVAKKISGQKGIGEENRTAKENFLFTSKKNEVVARRSNAGRGA